MNPARQILIVANPKSGSTDRRALVQSLHERLQEHGYQSQIVGDLEHFVTLAKQLTAQGRLRLAIAAGGDGTAAAVATRLAPQVPLGLFPLGTENLLARSIGQTRDVDAYPAAVDAMRCRNLDAALANGKLCLIMIGVGFDASVVKQVHLARRGHITKLTYAWPILSSAWSYTFPRLTITARDYLPVAEVPGLSPPRLPDTHTDVPANHPAVPANHPEVPANHPGPPASSQPSGLPADGQRSWSATWLFVVNLSRYAGELSIAPFAKDDDGYLSCASFDRGGRWNGLKYVTNIYLRRHCTLKDFRALRAKHFHIASQQPVDFQIDGDFGGTLPLEIQVLPARICLLLPNAPTTENRKPKTEN